MLHSSTCKLKHERGEHSSAMLYDQAVSSSSRCYATCVPRMHKSAVWRSCIACALQAYLLLEGNRELEGVHGLGGALELAVARLAAQVAVLVVSQGSVQGCQLLQLQPLVLVASLICGHQQILNHFSCLVCLYKQVSCQSCRALTEVSIGTHISQTDGQFI